MCLSRWCLRKVWWCSVKLNFLFSFDIRHPIQDEVAETDQERLKPLQNNPPLPFVSRDRILLDHRTKMEKYFMLWYKVGFWLGSSRDRQKTLWGNFFTWLVGVYVSKWHLCRALWREWDGLGLILQNASFETVGELSDGIFWMLSLGCPKNAQHWKCSAPHVFSGAKFQV